MGNPHEQPDEDALIPIQPLDEADEACRRALVNELLAIQDALVAETGSTPPIPLEHRETLSADDVEHFVVNYCLDRWAGKNDRAERHAAKLRCFAPQGRCAVDRLLAGQVREPALRDIPPDDLLRLLKKLNATLPRDCDPPR